MRTDQKLRRGYHQPAAKALISALKAAEQILLASFHPSGMIRHHAPGFGRAIAIGETIKQGFAQRRLGPLYSARHCGVIHPKYRGRRCQSAPAYHGQNRSEIFPIRIHAMHFRM